MKRYINFPILILLFVIFLISNKTEAQLLSGYNQKFYTSVFDAAEGVAMPFLLQQGFMTMPGVTIYNDTMLMYNGQVYQINSRYQNPKTGNPNSYYLEHTQYGKYQIEIFTNVWPFQIPNIFYNYSEFSFSSLADCVGYGTRLLSAVGDTTENGNAYLNLIKTIKTANTTLMAVRGYVASAYEIGAAFPTLPDVNPKGWEYVSGNIIADSINAYNHRLDPNVQQYNGRIKGGYSLSEAGDILSFSYGPGGESNGHFMVMTEKPYIITFDTLNHFYPNVPDTSIQNFLNTYNVWGTPVYDCSGQMAHFHDTRTYMSGIGHGVLWILTEPSTEIPVGFIFTTPSDTATAIRAEYLDDTHTWAISVGRYNDEGTEIGNNGIEFPGSFELFQNYPNPFNPVTTINYQLPTTNYVSLKIYNILGKEAAVLADGKMSPGKHSVSWDASGFASGVYYYRLTAGEFVQTRKLMLLK